MKRGRQSEAERSVIPLRPGAQVVQPPTGTHETIARLFRDVVASAPPGHFVQSDVTMLLAYCEAANLAARLAREAARKPVVTKYWATAARTQAALAVKLRLTPHSRTRAEGTARRMRDFRPTAYDAMTGGEGDDD